MNVYESYGHAMKHGWVIAFKWPQMTPDWHFDPVKSQGGLKLIHMYKSYGHAM